MCEAPGGPLAANGASREIIVRRPLPGETIEAIDHKTYVLGPEMCMICDARRPVAIGGVMGGAQTEISPATRDVLVESAEFDPVSIRNTARKLNLHSDSSYRFERRVDPEGLDWASRRCCELILEVAGGELAAGVVDVGQPPPRREPIVLRLSQLKRILGIDVPAERVREILMALGNDERTGSGSVVRWSEVAKPQAADLEIAESSQSPIPNPSSLTVIPPSWRRDLTREIDLVEEVGRIHGYEAIPEDVSVPMVPSARRRDDRVLERIRRVLDRRRIRRGGDAQRGRRADIGVVQPVDRRRAAAEPDAGDPRRRLPPPQPRAEPLGRAADQRGAGQRGDRAVRDRQGVSAARRANCRKRS